MKDVFTSLFSDDSESARIDKASKLLRTHYIKELENVCLPKIKIAPGEDPIKSYKRDDFFVDLALRESAQVDKDWMQNDRVYHLKTFEKIQQKINYDDLLTSDDHFLVLKGIAGIGKTSLLDYLVLQWAHGRLWNNKKNESQPSFDFVFRFNCRDLNLYDNMSVEELLKCLYPNIFCHTSFEHLIKHEASILIILDGLDEFCKIEELVKNHPDPLSKKTSVTSIIFTMLNGRFPNCKRILAGRPESVTTVYSSWARKYKIKRVDIVGFSEEDIRHYIDKFSINGRILKQKIDESSSLKAMCHIPIYLWILCSVFEKDTTLPTPKTMTELYVWAFTVFIREHYFSDSEMSLEDLLYDKKTRNILNAASYLSYRMVIERKVIFTKADIEGVGCCCDLLLEESTGFIVKSKGNIIEGIVYQFRHLFFQEFLCAVYCVMNDKSFYENVHQKDSSSIVIPIISGLQGASMAKSQSPDLVRYFVKSLPKQQERNWTVIDELLQTSSPRLFKDNIFYCFISSLYEFGNKMSNATNAGIEAKLSSQHTVEIRHSHVLDYFVHFLLLRHRNRKIRSLHKSVVWSVDVSNIEMNEYDLFSLSKVIAELSFIRINNAKILGTTGLSSATESILNGLKEAKRKDGQFPLKKLVLTNCDLDEEVLGSLSKIFPFINEVDLSGNEKLGVKGFAATSEAILGFAKEFKERGEYIPLKTLVLRSCNLNEDQLCSLSPALPFVKKVVLLKNKHLRTQGLDAFAKSVISAQFDFELKGEAIPLKILDLRNCNLTEGQLSSLSPALPFVSEVILSHNKDLGELGFSAAAQAIVDARTSAEQKGKLLPLNTLNLSSCKLNPKQLSSLSPAIPFIPKVDLSNNEELGVHGISAITNAILSVCKDTKQKGNRIRLETLSLKDCNIKENELMCLSPAVPFINEIDLTENKQLGTQAFDVVAKTIITAHKEAEEMDNKMALKTVHLRNCNLTEQQLSLLSPSIPFINEIDLSKNGHLGTQGFVALKDAVDKAHSGTEERVRNFLLKTLHLEYCCLNADQLGALAPALPLIDNVYLSHNKQLGQHIFRVVADTIVNAHNKAKQNGEVIPLKTLHLRDCGLNQQKLSALSPAIPFIKKIDLSDNRQQFGVEGVNAIAEVIVNAHKLAAQNKEDIPLKVLILRYCNFNEKELCSLSSAFPFLKTVDLSYSRNLGVQGFSAITNAIVVAHEEAKNNDQKITLKNLHLSSCKLNPEQLNVLSPALPFINAVDLSENKDLGTQGCSKAVEAINSAVRKVSQEEGVVSLETLRLNDCCLGQEEINALSQSLSSVTIET